MASASAAAEADPVIINLGKWFYSHPMPTSPGVSNTLVFKSPHSEIFVLQASPGISLAFHYHNNVDEFVYIVEGSAQTISGNKSYSLGKNDLQIIPMGTDHLMALMLDENIRFVTVFGLPEQQTLSQPLK